MEQRHQEQFLSSIARARERMVQDADFLRRFGIKPKHLCEKRIEGVKPRLKTIQGNEVVVGFVFSITRHPDGMLLKQFWSLAFNGSLRLLFEKPLDARAKRRKHCSRFIPRSELWGEED